MRKFKIFYSWQSDLPGNKTRNFIRDCIDEAIDLAEESEAIEAERDEATKNTTGSPNIVTTLFSKIDDCDLFIADVSLCFTSDTKENKKSPNPNVLLELGYAVKFLGWERVICLCNTDFGDVYPFDIAHNRITGYALEEKKEKEVKNYVRKIIFANIRDLRNTKPRVKVGEATHILGTYDFFEHSVKEWLTHIDIAQQESYLLHNQELLEESQKLIVEIQELNRKMGTKPSTSETVYHNSQESDGITIKINGQDTLSRIFKNVETPAVWKEAQETSWLIKKWLNINVDENFFNLGNLKYISQGYNPLNHAPTLTGTNEEKDKIKKLLDLSFALSRLELRTNYLKTFEGMIFVPIAIQNISTIQDEDISVVLKIENGKIIEPTEGLIFIDYEGLQGGFCRDDDDEKDVGIICELFGLKEDGIIHTENIPYNPKRYTPRMPIMTDRGFGYPEKSKEDYALELQEFIASANGLEYYEFNVNSLRPGECKWLCCGMLIEPTCDTIKITYHIHSTHSAGNLKGSFDISTV